LEWLKVSLFFGFKSNSFLAEDFFPPRSFGNFPSLSNPGQWFSRATSPSPQPLLLSLSRNADHSAKCGFLVIVGAVSFPLCKNALNFLSDVALRGPLAVRSPQANLTVTHSPICRTFFSPFLGWVLVERAFFSSPSPFFSQIDASRVTDRHDVPLFFFPSCMQSAFLVLVFPVGVPPPESAQQIYPPFFLKGGFLVSPSLLFYGGSFCIIFFSPTPLCPVASSFFLPRDRA